MSETARHTDNVVRLTPRWLAFLRGRKMFRVGKPCVSDIWTDDEWRGSLNIGQCERLGWMVERGMRMMEQMRVKEFITGDGDLDQAET